MTVQALIRRLETMDPHREVRAIVPFDFQQFRDMSFVVDGVVAAQDEDVIFLTR